MTRMMAACTSLLLVAGTYLSTPNTRSGTVWYVDDDAPNDPGPGDPGVSDPLEDGSAEHPFDAVQEGIDAATNGDTVLVLDGTYRGTGNRDLDFGGKLITVSSENGPEVCVIDCEGDPNYPHRGFYFDSSETAEALVDGFTITDGGASNGGAIYCAGNSSPTIANCTITRSEAASWGGGVYCQGGSPAIVGCTITENLAHSGAGGIRCSGSATVVNCTISANETWYVTGEGGGLVCSGNATVSNCTIAGNTAGNGAGVYCLAGTPTITNCRIIGNSVTDFYGGGVACSGTSATIRDCYIAENTGWHYGGGIDVSGGAPTIIDCRIARNLATEGAGVFCMDSDAAFINCRITRNEALWCGGISCSYGRTTITNCTIIQNTARQGGGCGGLCGHYDPFALVNSIVWDNTRGQICIGAGNPRIHHCDVQDGWPGEGNIDADPLVTRDGWHLEAGSPCVDAGDPNAAPLDPFDIDGEPRIGNGRIDMGPDEFHDADVDALPDWWELVYFDSPTAADPTIDEEGDGLVNLEEYLEARNPLRPPTTYYVDVDGDDEADGLTPEPDGEHGPKATIQAAINETHPYEGDTVSVADGTYAGVGNRDIDFDGKAITVRSGSGPGKCIVDCERAGRGFHFHSGEAASSVVEGLTITSALSDWVGGAVLCNFFSSPTIMNCVLARNIGEYGGGVGCIYYSDPTIRNCTITENSVHGVACYESRPTITNCILWDDRYGEVTGDPDPVITYSDVQYGYPGEGNIDADPLWVDPDGPDDDPNTVADNDYRLLPDSPCIDAADNDGVPPDTADLDNDGNTDEPTPLDLDRRLRFADRIDTPDTGNPGAPGPPIVDMGAYEYQCSGDLDGNGVIDLSDLATLLASYGASAGVVYPDGDVDRDGDIDLADLATLLAVYGTTCP